jgi:hypothetical protein
MIEVFKTNVEEVHDAAELATVLLQHFPACSVSFDLEDCDRVLRVEGKNVSAVAIERLFAGRGFVCARMD